MKPNLKSIHTGLTKDSSVSSLEDKGNRSESRKDHWSQLLERVGSSQDKAAFQALFQHFGPQIKYYALSNGLSHQAEELVQEVMISIWRRATTYNWRKAAASTWIFTIARNQRIDMLRKMQRTSAETKIEVEDLWQIPGSAESEPVTSLHRMLAERRIRESLVHLPEEQVTVIAKVYMEQKSHQMVAEELNIPLGTVKSRVRLALSKLKVILQDPAI